MEELADSWVVISHDLMAHPNFWDSKFSDITTHGRHLHFELFGKLIDGDHLLMVV